MGIPFIVLGVVFGMAASLAVPGERLGLVADAKTGDILETSVVDLFGNVTVIRFSGMEVDESPPDETFTFDPPEGVELIDYAAEAAGGFDSAAP